MEKGCRSELAHRAVEGLRGEAPLVARDLDLDVPAEQNGLTTLIADREDMRNSLSAAD